MSDANEHLKRAWHARDRLYLELYGPHKYALPKKYEVPLDVEMAEISTPAELAMIAGKSLTVKDINIVAHQPNEIRPYWIFASSGLSNPWFGQSEDVSGFGCELVLKNCCGTPAGILLVTLKFPLPSYAFVAMSTHGPVRFVADIT